MQEFDDPFDLGPQSRPTGQRTADGQEIRFVGPPLLSLNPATNDMLLVEEFKNHPLVAGRYFYSLPEALLKALVLNLGEDKFDSQLLRMERAFANLCGDHTAHIGTWRTDYVNYQGLRSLSAFPPSDISDEDMRMLGMDPIAVRNSLRFFKERDTVPLERFRRGYVGWLLTNQQFLDEHDVLLAEHFEVARRWGTQSVGIGAHTHRHGPDPDPTEDSGCQSFHAACEEFFSRWRLQSLAGPYLPIPLQPLMAGKFPWVVVQRLMSAGGVFFLPDTMPIPSRDQLRGLLDHALHRGEQPDHLEEWFHLIRASSGARNQLDRFGRFFEIQHYLHLLNQRHSNALVGNIGRMELALGQFFKVSTASIHADLIEIRERLKEVWFDRAWPI